MDLCSIGLGMFGLILAQDSRLCSHRITDLSYNLKLFPFFFSFCKMTCTDLSRTIQTSQTDKVDLRLNRVRIETMDKFHLNLRETDSKTDCRLLSDYYNFVIRMTTLTKPSDSLNIRL